MAGETWFVDWENKRINRPATEQEELGQTIERALLTDKFHWDIYTWNYGSQLADSVGQKNLEYVRGVIEKDVKDALAFEDRIISIEQFLVEPTNEKGIYKVSFVCITTIGEIRREFAINV